MAMTRKLILGAGGAAVLGAIVWALWPEPMAVDLAEVAAAPMEGTVTAEGVTRVRDPFTVAAPITGTTTRSPVEVGDLVRAGETVVAVIRPADPALMDARTRAQAEAAVTEAEAALALAETRVAAAEADLRQATSQLERGRSLAAAGTIARRMLEELETAEIAATQSLAATRSEVDLARASLVRTRAQLMLPGDIGVAGEPGECCLRIMAPHNGTVLTLQDPSARPVVAGQALLTLGNLDDLEIVVDLLSADAVLVVPGMAARIDRWGGPDVLEAVVRRVAPAAFTRTSALGIEEQRVRVHLDLTSPTAARGGLGDGFRVFVRLVLWQEDSLVQVPQAALFRQDGGWAVFQVTNGVARLVPVQLGRQVEGSAEVLGGLAPGDSVVLFPSSSLADGARVVRRGQ